MGLPSTLIGIVSFFMIVIFLVGTVETSQNQESEIQKLQNDMIQSINQTQPSSVPILGDTLTLLEVLWSGILLLIAYIQNFLNIASSLPSEFMIFFSVMVVVFVIQLIKLIRGV